MYTVRVSAKSFQHSTMPCRLRQYRSGHLWMSDLSRRKCRLLQSEESAAQIEFSRQTREHGHGQPLCPCSLAWSVRQWVDYVVQGMLLHSMWLCWLSRWLLGAHCSSTIDLGSHRKFQWDMKFWGRSYQKTWNSKNLYQGTVATEVGILGLLWQKQGHLWI